MNGKWYEYWVEVTQVVANAVVIMKDNPGAQVPVVTRVRMMHTDMFPIRVNSRAVILILILILGLLTHYVILTQCVAKMT